MAITTLAAAVLLGQAAFSQGADRPADVAYSELASGQTAAALRKLEESGAPESDDPAVLLNLGYAYQKAGEPQKAAAAYRAALSTQVRYDLQLADGTWVDSRYAARRALNGMLGAQAVASR